MKILLIHQYFLEKDEGGGSRFNEMTRVWQEEGHHITVLAGMVNYNTGKKPKRYQGKHFYKDLQFYENVDVIRCHVSESYNVNFLGRLWGYFSFMFSSIWGGLFKTKEKYDVILVTSPPLFVGMSAYILSKFKKIPFTFEVRDLWPESAIDTGVLTNKPIIRLAYAFEGFLYKKANLINVLTPAFKEKLIEKEVPENKIVFIPNAADFSLAEKIQQNFDANLFKRELGLEEKFVITYVGAHGVANHLIQIIDAAELLTNVPVVFQLIGSGMQKQMLQNLVEEKKLTNVIFREPVAKTEVFKYILASDMGASVLKKVDTFKTIYSNKTFDYMSCEKPILLAIDGVSRDLVEKADCGIYVEPENPKEIANSILKIYTKRERLIEMGKNGYAYAKEHFDRKKLANQYLEELKQTVNS